MSSNTHEAVLALVGTAITIKAVKLGFGHDRAGAMGNVYLGNKKAFEFHDDGWGGEVDVEFVNDDMKAKVDALIKEHNIPQVMFDNGWDFMKSVDKITSHSAYVELGEALIWKKTLDDELKKIQRKTKNKIVFGNDQSYQELGWSKIKELADLLKFRNGLDALQSAYNDAVAELKQGDRIFNTDEQLTALGVKLSPKLKEGRLA